MADVANFCIKLRNGYIGDVQVARRTQENMNNKYDG